ncbi:hypothetical protein BJ912DRAFT_995155 [Pholiota molesta]|nr:hypothetical protein BJ912DRAFT_995155 [Pholiota molesta]
MHRVASLAHSNRVAPSLLLTCNLYILWALVREGRPDLCPGQPCSVLVRIRITPSETKGLARYAHVPPPLSRFLELSLSILLTLTAATPYSPRR